MPKPSLFDKGILIMDASEDDLLAALRKSEKALFDELMLLFEKVNITEGRLSSSLKAEEFLSSLERRIFSTFKATGYNDQIRDFLISFDKISDNVIQIQSQLNNINVLPSQINPIKRIEIQNTIDALVGNKFKASVIQPLRQGLYRNVMNGATIDDTEKFLRSYIISNPGTDSKMLRYVKQLSRDSISQFDGALQQGIQGEMDLNAMRFVGSLIVDSRAQCRKWTEDGLIKLDVAFEKEIQKAIAKELIFDGKKASGMIPDTNIRTIIIYRGGYNCRHRAIPTKYFSK